MIEDAAQGGEIIWLQKWDSSLQTDSEGTSIGQRIATPMVTRGFIPSIMTALVALDPQLILYPRLAMVRKHWMLCSSQ